MLGDYELRDARWDDIEKVAAITCPADHCELFAASGLTPQMALWSGWRNSVRSRVGCYKGVPHVMYGVIPFGRVGYVWLAGASLAQHAKFFLRVIDSEMRLIAGDCTYLTNYMDTRQIVHRKLLERNGFVFDEDDTKIIREVVFIRFIRRMPDV